MPQDVFRPLEVPKAGTATKDTNGQKQHQQAVADSLHGSVDGLDRLPDGAALKRLGRLGQQRPHLRQLVIPYAKGIVEIVNDPVVVHTLHRADQRQNLLGKGNKQATKQTQQPLRPLTGVVALDAHAHLHNAPAENDNADGLDDRKNKIRQIVDDGQRITASGIGGGGRQHTDTQAQKKCAAYAPHHRSFHSVNPSSKINSSSETNAALISAQA